MTLPWKQAWQKKLDGLMARLRRSGLPRLDDLEQSKLIDKAREDRTFNVSELLKDPSVAEGSRRQAAIMGEHELGEVVLGCYVTVLNLPEGRISLAISWADGSQHGKEGWVPPHKFERIREYLGAPPASSMRSPAAFHWVWKPESPK